MSTYRYDAFIVWGHGIPWIADIMVTLRERFDIIILLRKTISNIPEFIEQVYDKDSYPIELIKPKTEYLHREKSEVVFILVRNNNVDLWDVDMGKYAKKECRHVAHTKVIIREKYNVHPHHHVIHGTDNQEEAEHLLSLFTDKPLSYYTSELEPFPFHIEPFVWELVDIDIRSLKGNIYGNYWMVGVEDTPQFLFAARNEGPYREYHNKHYGHGLIEDHFPERFTDMIDDYDNGAMFPPILVIGDRVVDGGHRCAIMAARGDYITKAYKKIEETKPKIIKKRVLLIGGTGGVGQSLLGAFDTDKYEVVAIGSSDLNVIHKRKDYYKFGDPEVVVLLSGKFKGTAHDILNTNCIGAVNIINGFAPIMREYKYGRIIIMSSVFAEINVPFHGVYSASKAFVDKFVKVSSLENAPYGVTINSIQLGYTGTGMGEVSDEKLMDKMRSKPALNRFCSSVEIANTIDYIVETEYLTGQNIRLDGGIK